MINVGLQIRVCNLVILHITHLCSLLHTLLKACVCRASESCKTLVLQDKLVQYLNILSPVMLSLSTQLNGVEHISCNFFTERILL